MKRTISLLTAGLLLAASAANAGGGADVDTEASGCTIGALGFAFGTIATIVQIRADQGQGIAQPDGDGKLTCQGKIPYGESTTAVIAFLPGPVPNVPVKLMTWEETCQYLPTLVPGASCQGGQGAIKVSGATTGLPCQDTYLDAGGNSVVRQTLNWTEVLTPGGPATVTCHF